MKLLILFMIFLALTGCISEGHKSKVYKHEIELYQPEKLKVLYAEEDICDEYYNIDLNVEIAKIELNTQMLRNMNADTDAWIVLARKELKKARSELARRKANTAEQEKQNQQLKEMKKELKEIEAQLELKLNNKRQKNGH